MEFVSKNYSLFKNRRKQIVEFIKRENPYLKSFLIVFFADFENDRSVFRQESSFFYLTGINEPGVILTIDSQGKEILYLPNYGGIREKWTKTDFVINERVLELSKKLFVDEIKFLGRSISSYSFSPVFTKQKYENFLFDFKQFLNIQEPKEVFTLLDIEGNVRYFPQVQIFKLLLDAFPKLSEITRDLAPLIHYLRRFKSEIEIDLIYKAVQITNIAHDAAARVIAPGRLEREIQAIIESVFIQAGSMGPAFPSIIATGKNTTVLHYTQRNNELKSGDLVVVDIGAEYGLYAADLTRTYPASGKFSKRQLEIYNIVLGAQNYVESIAKPGMFLNNKDFPEKSLNHLVQKYFENIGYSKYFTHGIGHFLGLDVHDVGDSLYSLAVGDVFTIEPGLYIPEENIGIRIEDDYLMTDDGAICLSFELPKRPEEIEKLMKEIME